MTCSIFIKSFPGDFQWLVHCLRSIHKFASDFHEVVIVIPEGEGLSLTAERVIKIKEYGDGYTFQQIVKMDADKYCDSDLILHMDSDCIFTEPVTPQSFLFKSKPVWLMTPMKDVLSGDVNTHAWNRCMTQFLGVQPEFEYMRRSGQVIPRWAHEEFRAFCAKKHGGTFEKWAFRQPFREVTEFNLMGFFLHKNFPDRIHFHDTRHSIPPQVIRQFWSHSGITEENLNEITKALK